MFAVTQGGADSWGFTYTNNSLEFDFLSGKTGGQSQRDVGPNAKGTRHEIGPEAVLYVSAIPNDVLHALSDQFKRDLLEELIQFLGVFLGTCRATPKAEG